MGLLIENPDAATIGKIEAQFQKWLERHDYPVLKATAPSPASLVPYREQRATLNTACNDNPRIMQPANPRLESLQRRFIVVVDADLAARPYLAVFPMFRTSSIRIGRDRRSILCSSASIRA